MKQIVQNYNGGRLRLDSVPDVKAKPGQLLIATDFSLISAGTEKQMVTLAKSGLHKKALKRPDLVKQVLDKAARDGIVDTIDTVRAKLDDPSPLGYSVAGTVTDIGEGVTGFSIGDAVAAAGAGFANHAEFNSVPVNLCANIPSGVEKSQASFCTVGAIALQGIRQAQPNIGETVVVIGLGLLGLISVQILVASGCRVIGYDIDAGKVELAQSMGAYEGCTSELRTLVDNSTASMGADVCLVTASTASNEVVALAASVARKKGTVVIVGMVGMDLPRTDFYEKELSLKMSTSYGPGRYDPLYEMKGVDYPYAYVRWTEQRNMGAFLDLLARERIDMSPLITHTFEFEDAIKAYETLESDSNYIGILLKYSASSGKPETKIVTQRNFEKSGSQVSIGVIGAGQYASKFILPHLKKSKNVRLQGVATTSGISAKHASEKFGFEFATTEPKDIQDAKETDAVIVATPHSSHAQFIVSALQNAKYVLCEKPASVDAQQFKLVEEAIKENGHKLMIGHNRRFSPFAKMMRESRERSPGPVALTYRINAGNVDKQHWIHSQEEGGRVLGECSHFFDLANYLVGAFPKEISVEAVPTKRDMVAMNIRFEDGSIGQILYTSAGNRGWPKEQLEIFGEDLVASMTDFRQLKIVSGNKSLKKTLFRQNKGQSEMLEAFIWSVQQGSEPPVSFADIKSSFESTLFVHNQLNAL